MRVGDLDFRLGVEGEDRVERSLEELRNALAEVRAAAESVDGTDVDLDIQDETDQLEETIDLLRRLRASDTEVDLEIEDIQAEIRAARAAFRRLEQEEINIDVDVDRLDQLAADISGFGGRGGEREGRAALDRELSQDLSRLQDEVFAVFNIFSRLTPQVKALIGALVTATVAFAGVVAAVGGLAAAATALATKFGGIQLRQALNRVKNQFIDVGRVFVREMTPLIRSEVIPLLRRFARELRAVIPELVSLTERNFSEIAGTFEGLIGAIVDTVQTFETITDTVDLLRDALHTFRAAVFATIDFLIPGVDPAEVLGLPTDVAKQAGLTAEAFRDLRGAATGGGQSNIRQPRIVSPPSMGEQMDPFSGMGLKPQTEIQELQRQVDIAREKFKRLESFTRKDFLEALVQIRSKGVDALLAVEQQTGENFEITDRWIGLLGEAQSQLQALESETFEMEQPADAEKVDPAQSTLFPLLSSVEDQLEQRTPQQLSDRISVQGISQLAQSADSIREVNSLIDTARAKMSSVGTEGKIALESIIGSLKLTRDNLKQTSGLTERFKKQLQGIAVSGLLRIGDQVGQSISEAIFNLDVLDGGISRVQKLKKELSTLQLQQRQQQLRERLGQASGLEAQTIQKQLQIVTEQLKRAKKEVSAFGQAFRTLGGIIKSVAQRIVQELIAVLAKMVVIRAITAIFSGGALGGISSIPGIGPGGVLQNPGVGQITGALSATGGPAPVPVQVSGEFRQRGTEMRATLDETSTLQRRSGRS